MPVSRSRAPVKNSKWIQKKSAQRLKKNIGYTSMSVQHFSPTNIIDGDSSSKLHRIIDAKNLFKKMWLTP